MNEATKKMLIFCNQKFAANNALYQKVVMDLNQRIKGYEKSLPFEVTVTQARNKFKKLVSECKAQSLTQRTATGLNHYKVEKGYGGKWWDALFTLVASRESSDRSNNIEPSADTEANTVLKGQSKKN